MEWLVRWRARLSAGRQCRCSGDKPFSRRCHLGAASVALFATALIAATWAFATTYVYDANGRMVVVTNGVGDSARYVYDQMGNLSRVESLLANDLAIYSFSPSRGGAGIPIKVWGSGFSTIVGENSLYFDGVPATITEATATEITTVVPAQATTGPISVTVGGNTAVSATSFVIDESSQPPVIDTVTPLITTVGTQVRVTGDSLNPVTNQTRAGLNSRQVSPTSITNEQIVFPVPANAASGKVLVTTPFGQTTSAQDVVVVPTGIDPTKVIQTYRLVTDGAAGTLATAFDGEYVAVLFDAALGECLSANFTDISVPAIEYWLYGAANELLASGTVNSTEEIVMLPQLTSLGTHLLLMKPVQGPATWRLQLVRDPEILINGTALDLGSSIAGQPKRFTFTATTGQKLGLGISDLVVTTQWSIHDVYFIVRGPNGAFMDDGVCYTEGCDSNLTITQPGIHSVTVFPAVDESMSFEATLSSDIQMDLGVNVSSSLGLPRQGQNGRLRFEATAGETLVLYILDQATTPADGFIYYSVYKPDGTFFTSDVADSFANIALIDLPVSGNYTIFVDSNFGAPATIQLRLVSSVVGNLAKDAGPVEFQTMLPGQAIHLTLNAIAGENLGLGISELFISGGNEVAALVHKPDGDYLDGSICYEDIGGCEANLPISETGEHDVLIFPRSSDQTMRLTATLSSDRIEELLPDTTHTLLLERRGQNSRLTFQGFEDDAFALQVTGLSTTPVISSQMSYTLIGPDGNEIKGWYAASSEAMLVMPSLPSTGTYTVFVDPYYGVGVSAQVRLLSSETTDTEIDGDSRIFGPTIAGQQVYLTFSAAAGQRLGLGISELSVSSGSWVRIYVYKPDSTSLANWYCYAFSGGCGSSLLASVTGIYRVVVTPQTAGQTMQFQATLSSDVTGVLQRNTSSTISLERIGQNGRLSFSATSGESLALQISNQATTPVGKGVYYRVFRSNGSLLTSTYTTSAGTLNLPNLPTTGNYILHIFPENGELATVQLLLATMQ